MAKLTGDQKSSDGFCFLQCYTCCSLSRGYSIPPIRDGELVGDQKRGCRVSKRIHHSFEQIIGQVRLLPLMICTALAHEHVRDSDAPTVGLFLP